MILHLHRAQVIEEKFCHTLNDNRVVPVEEGLLGVYRSRPFYIFCREQVIADKDIALKDAFKLIFVIVHNTELLERLQNAAASACRLDRHIGHTSVELVTALLCCTAFKARGATAYSTWSRAFKKVDFIRIDNSLLFFAPYFEVVGD